LILEDLQCAPRVFNIGQVIHQFLKPVRHHIDRNIPVGSIEKFKLTQSVVSLALGGTHLSPHLSENDTMMLRASYFGMLELLSQ
jgi:hypothetical protein